MGAIEEILKLSKETAKEIAFLREKVISLESDLQKVKPADKKNILIAEFSGKDRLNVSMAAKVIGIKQNAFLELVNKDKIQPTGSKMYFLAEEIIRYINATPDYVQKTSIKRNSKKKLTQNVIDDKEFEKLAAMQAE